MTAFGLQQHQYLQLEWESCKIGRNSGQSKENDWNEASGASFLSLRVGKGLSSSQAPSLRGEEKFGSEGLRDLEAKNPGGEQIESGNEEDVVSGEVW